MDVSTDPIESGEEEPDDLPPSSCNNKEIYKHMNTYYNMQKMTSTRVMLDSLKCAQIVYTRRVVTS